MTNSTEISDEAIRRIDDLFIAVLRKDEPKVVKL